MADIGIQDLAVPAKKITDLYVFLLGMIM